MMDEREQAKGGFSEKGATAVEYALVLSLLVLALIAGLDPATSTRADAPEAAQSEDAEV